MTHRPFKDRLKEHKDDIADPPRRSNSKLAGHIWDLKDRGIEFNLSWRFLAKAPPLTQSPENVYYAWKKSISLCMGGVQAPLIEEVRFSIHVDIDSKTY